jgi:hypothetical protein
MKTSKERPIIFQGWGMVAIRENRKIQTRRIAQFKPMPSEQGLDVTVPSLKLGTYMTGHPETGYVLYSMRGSCWNQVTERLFCPYGVPGDRLWVRETFREFDDGDVFYRADFGKSIPVHADDDPAIWKWQSSMFMPRRLARTLLEITEVRVQRVQEISEEDAKAEGVVFYRVAKESDPHDWYPEGYKASYRLGWDAINAKRGFGWNVNPWVWVISFRRLR